MFHVEGARAMTEVLQAAHGSDRVRPGQGAGSWIDKTPGTNYLRYNPRKAWSPSINLYESDDGYCVVVDLAGVRADEIDIRLENQQMVISGHRPVPEMCNVQGQLCLHMMEIDYGRFVRRLDVPGGVDVARIEAFYRSGYLWVHLPKV